MKLKLRMFTGMVVILVICMAALTGCTKSYDAKELCDIKVNGMNGYASVDATFDFDKMMKVVQKTSDNAEDRMNFMSETDNMKYKILSDNKKLSNGDKVKIEFVYDKKAAAKYGVAFKNTEFTYKIEGLKDPKVIDPFEGLKIQYTGVSPQASITFDKTGCDKFVNDNVTFTSEPNTAANGENVVVKIICDSQKTKDNSIVFSPEEKTFKVSGAPEYPADISKCNLTDLEKQFRDNAESKTAANGFILGKSIDGYNILGKSFSDQWEIKSIEYAPVKKIYYYAKDIKNAYIKNNYYILWEVKISAEKTKNFGWGLDSQYKVGDKVTVSHFAETYCQNIPANTDGTINTEKSTFNSNYYNKKDAEAIISEWKSKNVGDYIITEIE